MLSFSALVRLVISQANNAKLVLNKYRRIKRLKDQEDLPIAISKTKAQRLAFLIDEQMG